MNFQLTEDQKTFQDSVRKFAERHLRAGARARAHATEYPWDVAKLMADNGLLGITIAETDGGQSGTLMDAVIAIETIASVCPRSADVVQAGSFGPIRVFAEYGTPMQKQRYLAKILRGESVISVGMSEPEAGSAVTDLSTSATADPQVPGGYRINGSKVFSTHAPYADVLLVYVRFGPGTGGIGSVLIDTKQAGVRFGQRSSFMSGEEWAQIYFENAAVAPDMVVLKEGGFKKQIAGFNVERLGNTARSLALGRYAYEEARQWAMQRKQFGKLLCEFQGLQWKIRRHENQARRRPAAALPRCQQRRQRLPLTRRNLDRQSVLQSGRLRHCQRGDWGHGRPGLQPGVAGRILHAPLPRLDDCRRLDRDSQKPDCRRRV